MSDDLKSALQSMSQFISLDVGESFSGVYKGFKRVINTFDTDKETIELHFEVNGSEKSMTSMSLPKALVDAGIQQGDHVTVVKASKKGNTIVWSVVKTVKSAQPAPTPAATPEEKPAITDEELTAAGL